MKLVTFQKKGEPRFGILSGESVVDAQKALRFFRGKIPVPSPISAAADLRAFLATGRRGLLTLKKVEAHARAMAQDKRAMAAIATPLAKTKLLAPILNPPKIICIGQNYRDHCLEQNAPIPQRPIIFTKFQTCLIGHNAPIVKPAVTQQLDFEAELAFVIGKRGKLIAEENAMEHVAGYMIFHDVTARDIQYGDKQWVRGKSCDTFAPCGPWFVTKDEIPDPHNLRIQLWLNGELMQNSNTSQFIFSIPHIVSFLSRTITLEVGDIISTGTPLGVGVFRKPPIFMKAGDRVAIEIEGLGRLENPIVNE
jgi:2-keto-4-pentenoate hydratase/2-oxohepta-3-ene-1,7-dioic acid hydratase in catechol pathway